MFEEDNINAEEKKQAPKKKAASNKKVTTTTTKRKPVVKKKPSVAESHETATENSDVMNYLDLPSNGRLGYPRTIEYRDMYMGDESMLSTATDENYYKVLNKVLKSMLGNPTFFYDMTLLDRDYLLVWIWANSFSSKRQLRVTCPHCNTREDLTIDLSSLDVTDINSDIEQYLPFEMELKSGHKIHLDLQRVKHELEVEEWVKDHIDEEGNLESSADLANSLHLAAMEIEGHNDVPLEAKIDWAKKNIRSTEMGQIRMFHEYFSYGITDQIKHTCSNEECGEESIYTVPFRVEDFLQPEPSGSFEDLLQRNKESRDES